MKLITCLLLVITFVVTVKASNTEEVFDALTTLSEETKGADQVGSYVGHFCLTTQKMIRENKRGWYSIAKDDYVEMKKALSSDDLAKFKDAFLAFESVFYKFNGN